MAAPITETHIKSLADFDLALARGADYKKLALQGAAVGAVASLFLGGRGNKATLGHAVKYGAYGAGAAVVGIFALFEIGKIVSGKSHEAVAQAVTSGDFETGFDRFRGPEHFNQDYHHPNHHWGQQQQLPLWGNEQNDEQEPHHHHHHHHHHGQHG